MKLILEFRKDEWMNEVNVFQKQIIKFPDNAKSYLETKRWRHNLIQTGYWKLLFTDLFILVLTGEKKNLVQRIGFWFQNKKWKAIREHSVLHCVVGSRESEDDHFLLVVWVEFIDIIFLLHWTFKKCEQKQGVGNQHFVTSQRVPLPYWQPYHTYDITIGQLLAPHLCINKGQELKKNNCDTGAICTSFMFFFVLFLFFFFSFFPLILNFQKVWAYAARCVLNPTYWIWRNSINSDFLVFQRVKCSGASIIWARYVE